MFLNMAQKYGSLRYRKDFLSCRRYGRRFSRHGIRMRVCRAEDFPILTGISIFKSTGSAVQRNRAKRRIRHAVHELLSETETHTLPFKAVIQTNAQKLNRLPWQELKDVLTVLLNQTNRYLEELENNRT